MHHGRPADIRVGWNTVLGGLLGLKVGSRVDLGPELGRSPNKSVVVRIVAVVRPLQDAGWDRDPLAGAGYQADFNDGSTARRFPAYGPFLVGFDSLVRGGSSLSRMEMVAHPDFSGATPARGQRPETSAARAGRSCTAAR